MLRASFIDSRNEILNAIDVELESVETDIRRLKKRKQELVAERDLIREEIQKELQLMRESLEPNWRSRTEFPWSAEITAVSRDLFRHDCLRESQLEVINASLSQYDVFAVVKTGGGKSLCFQLLSLLSEKFTKHGFILVISPLLSLIRDQVGTMSALMSDTDSIFRSFAGTMSREEQQDVFRVIREGKIRMLYTTPERIAKSKLFMSVIQKAYMDGKLFRIVIDEVHCASQWWVYASIMMLLNLLNF
jgi:ATP-dependent DNA helicase Q1